MATLFRTELIELAYHEATYVFILVLRCIELVHYFATLLKVTVRESRLLLGHFIKILIIIRIRPLLGHSFRIEFLELPYYAATYVFISDLPSIELAQ